MVQNTNKEKKKICKSKYLRNYWHGALKYVMWIFFKTSIALLGVFGMISEKAWASDDLYEIFSPEKKVLEKSLRTTAQIEWSKLAWRMSTKNRCTPLICFYKATACAWRSYDGAGHVICQNRAWHTARRVAIYDKYEFQVLLKILLAAETCF